MKKTLILLCFSALLLCGFDSPEELLGKGDKTETILLNEDEFKGEIIEEKVIPNKIHKQNKIYGKISAKLSSDVEGIGINYWDQYTNWYIYENFLPENQKRLWDNLDIVYQPYLLANMNYDDTALATDFLSATDLFNAVYIYLYCHPQYYFLRPRMCAYYSTEGYSIKIEFYDKFKNGEERQKATQAIKKYLDDTVPGIMKHNNDLDRIKAIHDIVCYKVDYDYLVIEDDYNWEIDPNYSQSIYSAICTNKTVCAGYARLFNILGNVSGVNTIALNGSGHAWNMAKLGNNWYYVDPTWDDSRTDNKYFLVGQSMFNDVSHFRNCYWDNIGLPAPEVHQRGYKTIDGVTYYSYNETPLESDFIFYIIGEGNKDNYSYEEINRLQKYIYPNKENKFQYKLSRTGYEFLGWYDTNDNKVKKIKGEGKTIFLKAKWNPITYNLKFHKATKGISTKKISQSMSSIKNIRYDDYIEIPKCTYQRKGYKFLGWSTNKNKRTVKYKDGELVKNMTSKNKTINLYAVWQKE